MDISNGVKNNYIAAFVVGIISALVWFPVLNRVGVPFILVISFSAALPFLIVSVVFIADTFPKWKSFLGKLMRFGAIGFLNTGIDLAIFNFLMHVTGIETGIAILIFKSISFSIAVVNSFIWNRYWVFGGAITSQSEEGMKFTKFITVTISGILLNVGMTTLIISFIHPMFGLSQVRWNNIAALIATVFNLAWNFVGYYFVVFLSKKQD